jgi:hypothetical protein
MEKLRSGINIRIRNTEKKVSADTVRYRVPASQDFNLLAERTRTSLGSSVRRRFTRTSVGVLVLLTTGIVVVLTTGIVDVLTTGIAGVLTMGIVGALIFCFKSF